MRFQYNSSQYPIRKTLPPEYVEGVRQHLLEVFKNRDLDELTYGEIQQAFLSYQKPNGGGLLINQMEPLFVYFCHYQELPAGDVEE